MRREISGVLQLPLSFNQRSAFPSVMLLAQICQYQCHLDGSIVHARIVEGNRLSPHVDNDKRPMRMLIDGNKEIMHCKQINLSSRTYQTRQ